MTFKSWEETHNQKVNNILEKLREISPEDIVKYFDFDNMVIYEQDFCPLYASNTKCHDVKTLNCYFCGCPYFKKSDDKPLFMLDGVKIMSTCSINAKEVKAFVLDGIQQCDCSGCDIPHKKSFVTKYINTDGILNSLERVREYQLKFNGSI